jgi:hypothetical protein
LLVGGDGSGRARWAVTWVEARGDVQTHRVADLDRRLGQIDAHHEEAAKRRRTNASISR